MISLGIVAEAHAWHAECLGPAPWEKLQETFRAFEVARVFKTFVFDDCVMGLHSRSILMHAL